MARMLACAFVGLAAAQKAGKQTKEFHLPLPTQECTKSGGCSTKQTKVVIDGNWRWLHQDGTFGQLTLTELGCMQLEPLEKARGR